MARTNAVSSSSSPSPRKPKAKGRSLSAQADLVFSVSRGLAVARKHMYSHRRSEGFAVYLAAGVQELCKILIEEGARATKKHGIDIRALGRAIRDDADLDALISRRLRIHICDGGVPITTPAPKPRGVSKAVVTAAQALSSLENGGK